MKKKGKGRKNSPKAKSSSPPKTVEDTTTSVSPTGKGRVQSEQLPERSYSDGQNSLSIGQDGVQSNDVEIPNSSMDTAGVEATRSPGPTSSSPVAVGTASNRGEHQLEVGLHQLASYSKTSTVLSPLAPIFESNLNNIRDGADVVNKNSQLSSPRVGPAQNSGARGESSREPTREETAGEGPTRPVESDVIGAGAPSSFDSAWLKKFQELEKLENSRKKALEEEMQDARRELEVEMNRARVEHKIMEKRQEIERQQFELRKLEESTYGQSPAPTDTFINAKTPDRASYQTWEPNDPEVRAASESYA